MRIITISRQFGSGGRELGERLARQLGWDYYDKEIIQLLAAKQELDEEYVRDVLSRHGWQNIQLTYRQSFSQMLVEPTARAGVLLQQSGIIRDIAETGHDCVIVGRDADVILQEYRPFRLFVCADTEARLARCMRFEERKAPEQRLSQKEVLKNIRRIDKERVRTREILSGKSSADNSTFDLVVNAAGRDREKLAAALAEFATRWFEDGADEE